MNLRLSLATRAADDGSTEFVATLHNDGDEEVSFSTPSAAVFRLSAEDDEGTPVRGLSMGATQAVEHWTLPAGDAMTRTIVWESRAAWEAVYADLGRNINTDEMWEDVPEDYDELVVTVETCATDGPVADLSLTERVEVP